MPDRPIRRFFARVEGNLFHPGAPRGYHMIMDILTPRRPSPLETEPLEPTEPAEPLYEDTEFEPTIVRGRE